MALVINTNLGSINGQKNLNGSAASLSTAMSRLSNGVRVQSFVNEILGTNGDDTLIGTTDGDSIFGMSGNDILDGGDGNDYLIDDAGSNSIIGGNGDDQFVIFSSSSNDTDSLTGGAGINSYILKADNAGLLTVTDFKALNSPLSIVDGISYSTGSTSSSDSTGSASSSDSTGSASSSNTGITETADVTFPDLSDGDMFTLAGITVKATELVTSNIVATAFANLCSGNSAIETSGLTLSGTLTGYNTSAVNNNNHVVFTSIIANTNVEDLTASVRGGDVINISNLLSNSTGYVSGDDPFEKGFLRVVEQNISESLTTTQLQWNANGKNGLENWKTVLVLNNINKNNLTATNFTNDSVPLAISPYYNEGIVYGKAWSYDLKLSEHFKDSGNKTLSYTATFDSSSDLQIQFDATTGTLSASPTATNLDKSYPIKLTATNLDGSSTSYNFTVSVLNFDAENLFFSTTDDNMIEGATGNNTLSYINANQSVMVSLSTGMASGDGNDTFRNIENLIGSNYADTLEGGNSNETIINILDGGLGDDTYIIHNNYAKIIETGNGGIDSVNSSLSYVLPKYIENLMLSGSDNLNATGNNEANLLIGNSGNNILDGKFGMDTMKGGAGNDTYLVDNTHDIVSENTDEGIDGVFSSVSYTLSSNVENLTLTGRGAINGIGNDADNLITGNAGNNRLKGYGGNDTFFGGSGNDVIDGGDGDDVAKYSGTRNDYDITGSYDSSGISHLVVNAIHSVADKGKDKLTSIESLEFSDGTVSIIDIIGQAGTAMLAQANQSGQSVMTLLR